ncbi:Intraflagellar transport protein 27 [Thoreauomyces humboldtii]|nr:Intraflagellar transport protein 27 [Thoreauomyces humboldtii]
MTASAKLVLRTKCVVLGNAGVGKSAIVQMFHSDGSQYPKTYAMTIHCDVCVKVVNIPDTNVSVELFIHDVAGNDAFQEYWPRYLEGATGFVFVYDVTNPESFKAVTKWLHLAQRSKSSQGKESSIGQGGLLVANKVDQTLRRAVTAKQGEDFAKAAGLTYFECSAAGNSDVDAPFYYVSSTFYEMYEEHLRAVSRIAGVPE